MLCKLLSVVGVSSLLVIPPLTAPSAANLPVKAPPPRPAPAVSWTGFYLGASVGAGWSDPTTSNSVTATFCNPLLGGCPAAGPALAAAVPPQFATHANGPLGGVQAGYNFQSAKFVWGIEADISGAAISGSSSVAGVAPVFGSTITVTGTDSRTLNTFGTVRARLGVTVTDPLLVYATGGLAYGHVSDTVGFNEVVGGACFCGPSPTTTATTSRFQAGWTVGGGLEWMLAQRWSAKAEYLYYDLGNVTVTSPQLLQLNGAGIPFFGANISSTSAVTGSIVRLGLNYRL